MNERFNVGDKVYVTGAANPGDDEEREIAWVSSMDKFKGKIVTIKRVMKDYSFVVGEELDCYFIEEDNKKHYWSPIWFTKSVSELKIFLQHLEG